MATIERVRSVRIAYDPRPPVLGAAVDALVERNWARRVAENPRLYDGGILLFRDVAVAGGVLTGVGVPVRYSVMAALLDLRPEGLPLVNLFGAAAPVTADGAILLGRMAGHTFEPGAVKFAAGTPDAEDVDAGAGIVDIDASIVREFEEEVGLRAGEGTFDDGYLVGRDGPYLAIVRVLRLGADAASIAGRVGRFLAADPDPELAGIELVRRPDDPVLARASVLVRPMVEAILGEAADAPGCIGRT